MKKYDLFIQFPAGVYKDPIKTYRVIHVRTPQGDVPLPNPMYGQQRKINETGFFYAVEEAGELTFYYYSSRVIGRWPFNQREVLPDTRVIARFKRANQAGYWELV